MANGTIFAIFVTVCFTFVSGYFPVAHTKKPIKLDSKPHGCPAPPFADGSYSPEIPYGGICSFGTILHFKCKAGFKLDGPMQAKCKRDGKWAPFHIPICKKIISCKLHNPCGPNSKCVEEKGTLKCYCYKGYVAKGNKCFARACSIPKLGKYCQYTPRYQTKWFPGHKIQFWCPPGYDLDGPEYGTCLYGGVWDKSPPICKKRVYCKVPKLGYYSSYSPSYKRVWDYGQKIYFRCQKGFKKVGADYAVCKSGGKWNAPPAKCERPKLCDLPRLPKNCGYSPKKHSWNVGSQIYFHCPEGHKMVGNDHATCIDHGVWDKQAPLCNPPTLCKPPVVNKGVVYKPNFLAWHVGQKVSFYCPHDYIMVGHTHATCTKYGTWDNNSPICHPLKRCSLPELAGNLFQDSGSQSAWNAGQKIQFKCPEGYDLKGASDAVCQANGKWGNDPPVCIKKVVVACHLPILKAYCGYGPTNKKSWHVGEKILFVCPKGYDLKGHDYAVCQYDGSWTNDSPLCIKRDKCYVPRMSKYLSTDHSYHQQYFEVGHKMKFVCPKGYYLKGSDYAVCVKGGKWNKLTPICVRVTCHTPLMTPHCDYYPKHQVTWYPGQKVDFYCPYGYKLVGYPYAKCTYSGKWSNPAPVCQKKPVYCKAPPLPPTCHCKMTTHYKQYYAVGEIAHFSCPYGYRLRGYGLAKCMYNGYWSHPTPICIKKRVVKFGIAIVKKIG